MAGSDAFKHAIKIAMDASAEVSDPELRKIAFVRILDACLLNKTDENIGTAVVSTAGKRTPATARGGRQGGPSQWLDDICTESFFENPRTITDVVEAVRAAGHNVKSKDVTFPLEQLVLKKRLRRQKGPSGKSKRMVWIYRNY